MENTNREALLDQLEWFADELDAQTELLREVDEAVFGARSHEKGESLREVYLDLLLAENEWKHFIGQVVSDDPDQGNNSAPAPLSKHSGADPFSNRSTVDLMREISSVRRTLVSSLRSPDGSVAYPDHLDEMIYKHTLQDAVWLRKLGEMMHERRSILFVKGPRGQKN